MGTVVRYHGPFDEVEVPRAGMFVKRLKEVELETELAKSLLEQEDNWERPPAKRTSDKEGE